MKPKRTKIYHLSQIIAQTVQLNLSRKEKEKNPEKLSKINHTSFKPDHNRPFEKDKKNKTEKLSRICKYFQETMHYLSQIITQTVQLNSRRNEKEKILKSYPESISKNFQERWIR